jgi:hypothetical protein
MRTVRLHGHRENLARLVVGGVSAAVLLVSGAAPAGARVLDGADLAVDLAATGTVLIPGARYDVTVTNNGPAALTSATVVVALDPGTYSGSTSPCVVNGAANTMTCSFGPLPAGGTATLGGWAYFSLPLSQTSVDATATRTASVPADPQPGNDTDTAHCTYTSEPGVFPPPPVVRC